MSLLEVRDLQVRYSGVVAVRDVSLSVDGGQVLAILGANGAGKTSTLRAISGLVRATGSVLFDGQPLSGLAPEVVARQGIAHVPAGRGLFPTLSVAEGMRERPSYSKPPMNLPDRLSTAFSMLFSAPPSRSPHRLNCRALQSRNRN